MRGSSVLRRTQAAAVHWQPVVRTVEFSPLEGFKAWMPAQPTRFNWLAGNALRLFGYQPSTPAGSPAYWAGRNRWVDESQSWPHWQERVRRLRRKPGR
jgi:hypothetical protein